MSHFSTLVITKLHDPNDYDEITSRVEEKLAPYYEGLEVEPYIAYTIDEVRTEIDRNAREFHKQQTEKSKPGKWCIINKFPCSTPDDVDNAIDAVLQASENGDNELLSAIWYDWHGTKLDENGNSLTTYNPDSKWDWYQIGGRWCGCIPNDACPVRDLPDDIDDIVFAIVTPDGEWHAQGDMGWFACVSNENEDWKPSDILKDYQDYDAIMVDCHI